MLFGISLCVQVPSHYIRTGIAMISFYGALHTHGIVKRKSERQDERQRLEEDEYVVVVAVIVLVSKAKKIRNSSSLML